MSTSQMLMLPTGAVGTSSDTARQAADWLTRRESIRALVKQIEVSDEQMRIVYRVAHTPEDNPSRLEFFTA